MRDADKHVLQEAEGKKGNMGNLGEANTEQAAQGDGQKKNESHPGLGSRFWILWASVAADGLGTGLRFTWLPLLAAALTREPTLIAGLSVMLSLPTLLVGLIAGVIVDRADRRRLIAIASLGKGVLLALVGFAVITGKVTLFIVYAVALLIGSAQTVITNAQLALVPTVVARPSLDKANGRLIAAETIVYEFVGPALGGVLFTVAMAIPLLTDGGTAILCAVFILALRLEAQRQPEELTEMRSIWVEVIEGLQWLWRHRLIRNLGTMVAVISLVDAVWYAIFVLFALQVLGLKGSGYGILLAIGAAGSIIGGLTASHLAKLCGSGTMLIFVIIASGAAPLLIGITANVYITAGLLAVSGFALAVWNVITLSIRQTIVPGRLFGRVNSAYQLLVQGAGVAGAVIGGILAQSFNLRLPFVICGPITLLGAVFALYRLNNHALAAAEQADR